MISLAELSLNCQKNAMQNGALVPLETEIIYSDAWSPFILRKLLGPTPKHLNEWGPRANPFFPWDRNLEVLELDDHVLLLNKYPVEPGHLLLISKGWQPQSGWLTRTDWQALVDIWRLQNGLSLIVLDKAKNELIDFGFQLSIAGLTTSLILPR